MRTSRSPVLRLLFASVRSRWRRVAAALTLALMAAATGIVTPLLVARLISGLGDGTSLTATMCLLLVAVLGGALASGWSAYLLSTVGERAVAEVRTSMVRHVVRLPVEAIRKIGTGDLISRVGVDAAQLRALTDTGVTGLPVSLVMVSAYLLVMGILDWVMLLVVVGTFGLASIAIRLFLVGMRRGTQERQEALGRLAGSASSVFDVISTIKAFGAERRAVAPVLDQTDGAADAAIRTARYQAAITPLLGLGQQVAIVGVLSVGGARVAAGALSAPAFVAFLMYLFQLVNPLMTLAQGAGRIQQGLAAGARMDEVIATPPESAGAARPPRTDRTGPALQIDQVHIRIGETPVLDDVSIDVPRTGVVGIVGPSGAGKSTVLNVVERFVVPDRGVVRLFGAGLDDWPLAEARGHLALVEQGTPVLSASIRENLTLGRPDEVEDDHLWGALDDVGLARTVRALPDGLDTTLGSGIQLSGGEIQRLAIARALLADPAILLLDEPSSQLDGVNERRLVSLLRRLARTRAVVVVAHRLSTVRSAESIVVMDAGQVVAVGRHSKLMSTCPQYRALAGSQLAGEDDAAVADAADDAYLLAREGA